MNRRSSIEVGSLVLVAWSFPDFAAVGVDGCILPLLHFCVDFIEIGLDVILFLLYLLQFSSVIVQLVLVL